MQASLLKKNLDYLKNNFSDFYNNVMNPQFASPSLKIHDAGQPYNLLLSNNGVKCNLHSRYNIDREMETLFKPVTNENNQVIVIFGLGYGHCVDYIKKKHIKFKRLVIFEPCTDIFFEVLKKREILNLLGMNNLFLHIMNLPNDMAKFLLQEAMESKSVKILYHMSYRTLFHEIYDNILRSFRNERIAMEASLNTMRAKSFEWNSQQLKTIQKSFPSASAFAGKFKDVPAVIASAGPSLEKHFGLLNEIGDRAIIVAPGSTTRIFNARGINAHIAMSIDSNIIQAGFYKNFNLKSILVASYRLHPETYTNFPNEIFFTALSTEYLTQYYYDWIDQKPFIINDHASVSMAAVDMLFLMGCNPIILAGQDLSYQNNRNYAGDSANSISEAQFNNLIPDVDIYGNKVFTDYGYKAMQNDMELQNIRYGSKIKIYNATEGGLDIHGIENVKFTDVFEKHIKNRKHDVGKRMFDIIETVNNKEYTTDNSNILDNNKSIVNFINHLLEKCNDVETILNEKDAAFIPFAKLIERGVSNNRLNNEMKHIQSFNDKLNEIKFFKHVVMPNIDSSLAYFRASGKHIADSGQDWEGAAIFEQKLDEYALGFVNTFKVLLLRELVGDFTSLSEAEQSEIA